MKAVTVLPFLSWATGCAGYLRATWLRHREYA